MKPQMILWGADGYAFHSSLFFPLYRSCFKQEKNDNIYLQKNDNLSIKIYNISLMTLPFNLS